MPLETRPLENVGVFSNDASILFPTSSLGTDYWVMTRDHGTPFRSVMTIVGTQPGETEVTVRLPFLPDYVRPGGTVAGPLMMALADFAMWVAVMSHIGPQEMAVTSNLSCNFLRRPKPKDVIGEARMLKVGKRLAYGEVSIFTAGEEGDGPVAHITATYSIPPER